MLAYELYVANKDNKSAITRKEEAIKKIFFEGGEVTVEDVDSPAMSSQSSIRLLQDWLSMPLNTTSYDRMKLADISVQSSQKPPYVRIYCRLEKRQEAKDTFAHEISMTVGKGKVCSARYDVEGQKLAFEELIEVPIRINKDDYFTADGTNLFEQYVSAKVLTQDATLKPDTFKKIITKFIENLENHAQPSMAGLNKKSVSFWLYVLPTRGKISKKEESHDDNATFVDAFGNDAKAFPSKTTLTAKFLSADDQAFTINCAKLDQMYENLGIGNESLPKVELLTNNEMWVAGYSWAFIDMLVPSNRFHETKKGILYQLKHNYEQLSKDHETDSKLSTLKVLCMIKNQNKIEIILDENLSLPRQKQLFASLGEVPAHAFEVMIPKQASSKSKPIWGDYMHVVKSFISQTKLEKGYFVSFFTRQLYGRRLEMIDDHKAAQDFFTRAEFTLKFLLYPTQGLGSTMAGPQLVPDEAYAQNIGMIARFYIDFKRQHNEQNNSLLGILKYSKYDRSSLQNVLKKVGAGIALSNANDEGSGNQELMKLERQIQDLMPSNEIAEPSNDYAYFFYKGYFTGDKN